MHNLSESSKSRMQRIEEPHVTREPQFGHPCTKRKRGWLGKSPAGTQILKFNAV